MPHRRHRRSSSGMTAEAANRGSARDPSSSTSIPSSSSSSDLCFPATNAAARKFHRSLTRKRTLIDNERLLNLAAETLWHAKHATKESILNSAALTKQCERAAALEWIHASKSRLELAEGLERRVERIVTENTRREYCEDWSLPMQRERRGFFLSCLPSVRGMSSCFSDASTAAVVVKEARPGKRANDAARLETLGLLYSKWFCHHDSTLRLLDVIRELSDQKYIDIGSERVSTRHIDWNDLFMGLLRDMFPLRRLETHAWLRYLAVVRGCWRSEMESHVKNQRSFADFSFGQNSVLLQRMMSRLTTDSAVANWIETSLLEHLKVVGLRIANIANEDKLDPLCFEPSELSKEDAERKSNRRTTGTSNGASANNAHKPSTSLYLSSDTPKASDNDKIMSWIHHRCTEEIPSTLRAELTLFNSAPNIRLRCESRALSLIALTNETFRALEQALESLPDRVWGLCSYFATDLMGIFSDYLDEEARPTKFEVSLCSLRMLFRYFILPTLRTDARLISATGEATMIRVTSLLGLAIGALPPKTVVGGISWRLPLVDPAMSMREKGVALMDKGLNSVRPSTHWHASSMFETQAAVGFTHEERLIAAQLFEHTRMDPFVVYPSNRTEQFLCFAVAKFLEDDSKIALGSIDKRSLGEEAVKVWSEILLKLTKPNSLDAAHKTKSIHSQLRRFVSDVRNMRDAAGDTVPLNLALCLPSKLFSTASAAPTPEMRALFTSPTPPDSLPTVPEDAARLLPWIDSVRKLFLNVSGLPVALGAVVSSSPSATTVQPIVSSVAAAEWRDTFDATKREFYECFLACREAMLVVAPDESGRAGSKASRAESPLAPSTLQLQRLKGVFDASLHPFSRGARETLEGVRDDTSLLLMLAEFVEDANSRAKALDELTLRRRFATTLGRACLEHEDRIKERELSLGAYLSEITSASRSDANVRAVEDILVDVTDFQAWGFGGPPKEYGGARASSKRGRGGSEKHRIVRLRELAAAVNEPKLALSPLKVFHDSSAPTL